jgi:hypothetical protein
MTRAEIPAGGARRRLSSPQPVVGQAADDTAHPAFDLGAHWQHSVAKRPGEEQLYCERLARLTAPSVSAAWDQRHFA